MGLPILDKAEQNAREQGRKLTRDYDILDAGSIGVALALLEQC